MKWKLNILMLFWHLFGCSYCLMLQVGAWHSLDITIWKYNICAKYKKTFQWKTFFTRLNRVISSHKSHHEVKLVVITWPQSGSLDPMNGGSSDSNPTKKVSRLIFRNHVQAFKDICFQYTFHTLQMSYNRLGFYVYHKLQRHCGWLDIVCFPRSLGSSTSFRGSLHFGFLLGFLINDDDDDKIVNPWRGTPSSQVWVLLLASA